MSKDDDNLTPGLKALYADQPQVSQPSSKNEPYEEEIDPDTPDLPPMNYNLVPPAPPEPTNPNLLKMGEAAGAAYFGHKARQAGELPPDLRNTAINLRRSTKQTNRLRNINDMVQQELNEAKAAAEHWANPETVKAHIDPNDLPFKYSVEPPAPLTEIPAGGEATYNYAIKEGATHRQAMDAASYSTVQGETIPENVSGIKRVEDVEPGVKRFKETELALTPKQAEEYAKMIAEQAEQQKIAQQVHEFKMRQAEANAKAKIEPQVRAAQDRLSKAQANAANTENQLKNATTKQLNMQANMTNKIAELPPRLTYQAEKIAERGSRFTDVLGAGKRALGKVLTPLSFASIPLEAQQAYQAGKEGDWKEAGKHAASAVASGLGVLPVVAEAIGLAPEIAGGLALAGGAYGAYELGKDLYENYPEYKEAVKNLPNKLFGR